MCTKLGVSFYNNISTNLKLFIRQAGGGSDPKAHAMNNDFDWLLMAGLLLQSSCKAAATCY